MNRFLKYGNYWLWLACLLPLSSMIPGQAIHPSRIKFSSHNHVQLKVHGTSTLHDWDMQSNRGDFEIVFLKDPAGHLRKIDELAFHTKITSLTGPYEQMNTLAHEAFKSESISFTADSARLQEKDIHHYHAESFGKLNMADTVRNVRIEANITINPDHSIQITGQKSINMTDHHIIPPSFMMGAFKVDRSILLKFNLTAFP